MDQLREETASEQNNPGAPRLPAHPFRGLWVGESGCGKTHSVIENLILDPESPFDRVIWVAPAASLEQPIIKRLEELHEPVDVPSTGDVSGSPGPKTFFTVPGLGPDEIEDVEKLIGDGFDAGHQTLLVIDDCLCEGNRKAKQLFVDRMFTSGRHRNVSTVMLVQRVFAPESRTARINCDVFWISSFGDRREAKQLFQQLAPASWKQITAAHRDVRAWPRQRPLH